MTLESFITLHEDWWEIPDTYRQVIRLIQKFYQGTSSKRIQPKRKWLADKIGVTVGTISRALAYLRKMDWINTVFRGRKGNLYDLPDWMQTLDLQHPERWLDDDSEDYIEKNEVLKTGPEVVKSSTTDRVSDRVNDRVNDRDSGEYTYRPIDPLTSRSSKTGNLRDGGNVHSSSSSKHSHDSDLGFFKMINLEPRSAIDVANMWVGFEFQDRTVVTDNDMRIWLKTHGSLATHCAMIAYRCEIRRRVETGTATKAPGVRFVQFLLSSGRWKKILQGTKNRDTAMNHIRGAFKAFYRVNYSTAYIDKDYDLSLEDTPVNVFEDIIRNKTGIEPRPRENAFDRFVPGES